MPTDFRVGTIQGPDKIERILVMDPNYAFNLAGILVRSLDAFHEQMLRDIKHKDTPTFHDAVTTARLLCSLTRLEAAINKDEPTAFYFSLSVGRGARIYRVLAVQSLWNESVYMRDHLVYELEEFLEEIRKHISDQDMADIENIYLTPLRSLLGLEAAHT